MFTHIHLTLRFPAGHLVLIHAQFSYIMQDYTKKTQLKKRQVRVGIT